MRGSGFETPTSHEKTVASNLPAERRLVPDLRDVLGADADHPEQMAAAAQLVECRERVGSRDEHPPRPLAPQREDLVDARLDAELAEQSALK